MANVNVKIDGKADTIAELQKQHELFGKKIRPIVLKYAKNIVKEYRDATPVGKTGNLRNAVTQKLITRTKTTTFISGTARSIIARKGKKGYHRHLVAYGTAVRTNKRGANRGKMPENKKYASIQEKTETLNFDREIEKMINEDKKI